MPGYDVIVWNHMKAVINRSYGGFGLSEEAHRLIAIRKGWKHAVNDYDQDYWYDIADNPVYATELERTDPDLIAVVEELGPEADWHYSNLKVVEVPDDVRWHIHEYDGKEEIHENHRIWS